MVSVIIPAYNEADSIQKIIEISQNHKWVDEVLVVDDGSEDNTADKARKLTNKVIKLPNNKGKAQAMDYGVANANNDIICFLDGDLINLQQKHLTQLIEPIIEKEFDMFVGICGRSHRKLSQLLIFLPRIGGQRILTKKIWNQVPNTYKRDFQIELALNYFCRMLGKKMGVTILKDLEHIPKEKKYGIVDGLTQRVIMFFDILKVSILLYGYETLKRIISSLFSIRKR